MSCAQAAAALLALALLVACNPSTLPSSGPRGDCSSASDCGAGAACIDGRCVADEELPPPGEEEGCVDLDRDGYGVGCARGLDCNDGDAIQTGSELCDGLDNDCDGVPDNGVLSACGDCNFDCEIGESGVGTPEDFVLDDSDGVGLDDEGAIILDSRSINTDIIWIANTPQGSVSLFDTETYIERARFMTGPAGSGNDPSRTSVNSLGDVYVGNRGGATVSRISLLGEDCPDTNGDGVITTSRGGTELLAWGQDDCVLWNTDIGRYAPAPGGTIRSVAAQDVVGPDGELRSYVWIGAYSTSRIYKLDGETGEILLHTDSPGAPYGVALDAAGNLWVSSRSGNNLGRIDTNRCVDTASCAVDICRGEGGCDAAVKQLIDAPWRPYGITVDFHQRVWMGGDGIMRYDPTAPAGARFQTVGTGFVHGIAADAEGFVWGAGGSNGIMRVTADAPGMWTTVAGTPGYSHKGMAVDSAGKVWSITRENRAVVVTPGPGLMDASVDPEVARSIVAPYTYSDMTGLQLRLATNPRGYWRRVFEGCPDGTGAGETEWGELRWSADLPAGTALNFRVRTADDVEALASAEWVTVASAPPDVSPASVELALQEAGIVTGRFLELEVVLIADRSSTTEVITPRVRSVGVTHVCPPDFG